MAYFYQYHDLLMSNPITAWLDLQPMKHVVIATVRAFQERERNGKLWNDMIEHWKSQNQSEPMTEKDLLATANANMAAGVDTVAGELQAFVYLLLRNSDCLRQWCSELDSAASDKKISSPV